MASLSLPALTPGAYFSYLLINFLGSIFLLKQGTFICIKNLLRQVVVLLNYFLNGIWELCCLFISRSCCFCSLDILKAKPLSKMIKPSFAGIKFCSLRSITFLSFCIKLSYNDVSFSQIILESEQRGLPRQVRGQVERTDKSDTPTWRPAKGRGWRQRRSCAVTCWRAHSTRYRTILGVPLLIPLQCTRQATLQHRISCQIKQNFKKPATGPFLHKGLCPQTPVSITLFQYPLEQYKAFLWRMNRGLPQLGYPGPSPLQGLM